RAMKALEECDVCIIMVDAENGISSQDLSIFGEAKEKGKGIVIVVNKWDLLEKNNSTLLNYEKYVREKLKPFVDVPIVFTSVLNKQRVMKVIETTIAVYENRRKKIPTSQLNKFILPFIEATPPPAIRGRIIRINYITQLPTAYPQF